MTDIDRIAHTLAVTNDRADMWKARAVAAETALAEANEERSADAAALLEAELRKVRAERDELADALRPLLDAHKDEAHSMPGEAWGYDAAGIHGWEPGEPQECPICEALDAARAALDRQEQRYGT